MLIPSISNATADEQRIIGALKRNTWAISQELDSCHVIGTKRARPTMTLAAQGNRRQLFLLTLLATVNCVSLYRGRQIGKKASNGKFKILKRPIGVWKSVHVCACGNELRADVSSDVTRGQHWQWCGKLHSRIKRTRLAPRYHLPPEALHWAPNKECGHVSYNTSGFSWLTMSLMTLSMIGSHAVGTGRKRLRKKIITKIIILTLLTFLWEVPKTSLERQKISQRMTNSTYNSIVLLAYCTTSLNMHLLPGLRYVFELVSLSRSSRPTE